MRTAVFTTLFALVATSVMAQNYRVGVSVGSGNYGNQVAVGATYSNQSTCPQQCAPVYRTYVAEVIQPIIQVLPPKCVYVQPQPVQANCYQAQPQPQPRPACNCGGQRQQFGGSYASSGYNSGPRIAVSYSQSYNNGGYGYHGSPRSNDGYSFGRSNHTTPGQIVFGNRHSSGVTPGQIVFGNGNHRKGPSPSQIVFGR